MKLQQKSLRGIDLESKGSSFPRKSPGGLIKTQTVGFLILLVWGGAWKFAFPVCSQVMGWCSKKSSEVTAFWTQGAPSPLIPQGSWL